MPVIVNAYKNDTSLGDTLSVLGEHLFGKDAAQGEFLRQKTHGLRRNSEAIGELQRQAATPGGVDYGNPNARAAAYGLDNPKEAFEAQRGIAANQYGAMDPRTTNATVGAGGNYASTGQGFTAAEANTMARAKMQADTAAQTAIRTAEMTPVHVIDPTTKMPRIMSRAEAIRLGVAPVLSASETEGALRQKGFESGYEGQNPEQKKASGVFVPYGQTEAGHTTDLASKENIAQRSDATRAASAERIASNTPLNVIDPDTGLPFVSSNKAAIENKQRPVLGASEEQGILRGQGFKTGYAGQNPSQLVASGAQPSAEHLYNWTTTGPNGEVSQGRSVDGRTDLTTGQPLPAEARVTGVNNAAATKDLVAPTNTVTTHQQEKHANNRELLGMVQQAEALVDQNPYSVGATGNAQQYGQRAQLAAAQMAAFLGKGKDWQSATINVRNEAAQKYGGAAAQLFPELYNPSMTQLDALYGMMTYKTAQALFGQEGRGLNIEDIRQTRALLGNPGNWTTNPHELKTRLGVIRNAAQSNVANSEAMLRQRNALQPVTAPAGGQPTSTQEEVWVRDPATGQLRRGP